MEGKALGQVVRVCPVAIDRMGPARLGERGAQRECIRRREGIWYKVHHLPTRGSQDDETL